MEYKLKTYSFENLLVWQKSRVLAKEIYKLTATFPKEELFGLTSQYRNAANSISLNIGEGYGESIPLALRYLRITIGSIRECLVCSTIAFRRKYMDETQYSESRERLVELSKLSAGYRKYLNSKLTK
jgi:four helix bundle protein